MGGWLGFIKGLVQVAAVMTITVLLALGVGMILWGVAS